MRQGSTQQRRAMMENIDQFREAIKSVGLIPPDTIEPGQLHRFPGAGKRNGNTAGWCKLFADGLGGVYGDYSQDISEQWQVQRSAPFTQPQREAFLRKVRESKEQAEAEQIAKHADAAIRAAAIWQAAQPAGDHPYLTRKGIQANGVRLYRGPIEIRDMLCDGALVIPVREGGKLHSLQFIVGDGSKRHLPGGRKKGCYFSIGNPKGAAALCIAEGFATGATIHDVTGLPVAVAFDAGNLEPVAMALRSRFPDLTLILCADDDVGTEGNPGVAKATASAQAVGAKLAIPDFGANRPEGATDFNDLATHCGKEAVQRAVAGAIDIPARPTPQPNETNGSNRDVAGRSMSENGQRDKYSPDSVVLVRGDTIQPEAIRWLWEGWLAQGKFHVLAGAPGTGKTTIALAIAATISSGGRWPDGSRATIGNVLMWSGEDDPKDTLAPRLIASGADMQRIYFVSHTIAQDESRPFDPARDMETLTLQAAGIGNIRLLIVDPVVSAVAGDSHKNGETRRALQPLVDLAQTLDCAALGISHYSKGTAGRDPVERVTGSIAFGALARIVLGTAKGSEEEDKKRRLVRAKSNIGPDGGGFEYDLEQTEVAKHPGMFASRVLWCGAIEGGARELLAEAETPNGFDIGSELENAKAFLLDLLEHGSVPSKQVTADATGAGLSIASVRRAKSELDIKAIKTGLNGGWAWQLPSKVLKNSEDAQQNCVSAFGKNEHLREAAQPETSAGEVF